MDERRVSIDGVTYPLDQPFFVIATQNPEEFYGTYPLPESQLDRFLLRIHVGYPEPDVERQILMRRRGQDPTESLGVVASKEDLLAAQNVVDDVRVDEEVIHYLHRLVLATRESKLLSLGASTPRRTLLRACGARASPGLRAHLCHAGRRAVSGRARPGSSCAIGRDPRGGARIDSMPSAWCASW